jgi:hypothetical protein
MSGPLAPAGGLPSWWKVCFVYGDQTKVYRKLYGRKSHVRSLKSYAGELAAAAGPYGAVAAAGPYGAAAAAGPSAAAAAASPFGAAAAAVNTGLSDGDQDSM